MRGSLIAACLAVLVVGLPARSLAADPSLLTFFLKVCASHAFDHAGAEAAARAAGFGEIRTEAGKSLQEIALQADLVALEGSLSDRIAYVALAQGQDPARPEEGVPKSDVSVCTITLAGTDEAGVQAVRDWVRTPKSEDFGFLTVYGYRDTNGVHTAAPDSNPAMIKAALEAGEHRLLVVIANKDVTSLILQSGRAAKP